MIDESAFEDCENLKEVIIEEDSKLQGIETEAFYNCEKLKRINFPDGLKYIGMRAFRNTGLQNVEFPAALMTISAGAFCECKRLEAVKFGEGLEELGTGEYIVRDGAWGVFDESTIESV